MAVMDEFREEREALKHGTPKEKLLYFWCYYKWYVIGIIAVIAFAGSLIYEITSQKEEMFYAAVLNSLELDGAAAHQQNFADYAEIDTNKYSVSFDSTMHISFTTMDETSMTSTEKLMVYIAAAQLDVIIAGENIFEHYADGDTFYDLRDILSEEQLNKYEPYFYYVDRPLVEQIAEAEKNLDNTFDPEIPDPTKPELMEDPIPVGIFVDSCEGLAAGYYNTEQDRAVLGVLQNVPHLENTLKYIDFLFEQ